MICSGQRRWSTGLWFLLKSCLVAILQEDQSSSRPATKAAVNGHGRVEQSVSKNRAGDAVMPEKLPTLVDIRKVIPKHCFEPKVSTSMYYVALNIAGIAGLYAILEGVRWTCPTYMTYAITPMYWFMQGTFFAGLFVLGHDCGHGSFSKHPVFNDVVGNVLHTFLTVPYYCWKLTHRNHHKNTGNIDKDEVFYPIRKKDDTGGMMLPGFGLGFGWYAYIVRGYKPRQVCHLNIFHHLYANHAFDCAVSLASVGAWIMLLYCYAQYAGWIALVSNYVIPALGFGSWVVIFTFLHHSEEGVPWYSDDKWDFVKGQLSSVDRDYGWAQYLIHTIGTHQIHHLFSKVPHYHLDEATAAFRKSFPGLVRCDDSPILPSFIRMFKKYMKQSIISDEADFHIYK